MILRSRYGDEIELIKISDTEFKIPEVRYLQVAMDEDEKIISIDPPGGPLVMRDYFIDGYKVEDIKYDQGYILVVKDMKTLYNQYLFNCHCEGDIWNEDYRPYEYEEWVKRGMPDSGGIKK